MISEDNGKTNKIHSCIIYHAKDTDEFGKARNKDVRAKFESVVYLGPLQLLGETANT